VIDRAFSLVLLMATLIVALAYGRRVRRSGPARHSRIDRAGSSFLLGKGAMQMGYWAIRPVASACIALGIGANAVSCASLALGAAAGVALALGYLGVGAALGVVSSACDALDGMIARETGTASDAGEVLDATVDRYTELFFLGGIAFHERNSALAVGLALAATAGAVMVSYATAKAEALHVQAPRGAMRRQERAVYLVLGAALTPVATAAAAQWALPAWIDRLPLLAALALVAAVGNASAVRRLYAVAQAVRKPEGFGPNESVRKPEGFATNESVRKPGLLGDVHAAAGDTLR
jgi:phosphatidylglycerophosphate synthase